MTPTSSVFRKLILFITNVFAFPFLFSQTVYHDFGFERNTSLEVYHTGLVPLQYAWSGGMNSVRFSEIDLNLDGVNDLFIFEKNGNRILPFICEINGSTVSYRYAPEYIYRFPTLHDWVILKDYDGDGKADIFTYGVAGIRIFRNISETELRFELVTDQLQSYYYNAYSNLFTSPDDYIAIEDIDGDGDLDILSFWLLGKYVHFHRNYSVENFGNSKYLDFKLEDECWGKFAENENNNEITLNADCSGKTYSSGSEEPYRHTGSSMFLYDYNGDGVQDLILGDLDYPNLLYLENGGTVNNALMVSQDPLFPNVNTPVHLFSMPAASFIDIDHDQKPELIASPSDPSYTKSQNHESVWMYKFDDISGHYELQTKSFLQDQMIDVGSGAYPVLYDWNQDGLEDLFVANYGYYDSSSFVNSFLHSYYSSSIAYYQNTGDSENPKFQLITTDFGSLRQYGLNALYPAFGDFNGDGTCDILCGNSDGQLILFANNASAGGLPSLSPPVYSYNSIDVGDFSTPQYFDLDNDGKKDLLIGNKRGRIAYYKDVSTNNIPQFQLINEELGDVDTRDFEISYFGYSVPCFFRNNLNETVLFCGSEQGNIYYYKNIDGNIDGQFLLSESSYFEVLNNNRYAMIEGRRVAPSVSDIDHDGFIDLFIGNYAGGLSFFSGITPPLYTISTHDPVPANPIEIYPNPAGNKVTILHKTEIGLLTIYTIQGQQLYSQKYHEKEISLDLSAYNSGVYFIQCVDSAGKTHLQKLVITK